MRVRYERGVLKPLREIEAVEGEEFEVMLVGAPKVLREGE